MIVSYLVNGHKIAALIKKHFPDITTVVGGAHSSALPEQTIREFPHFDIVAFQEGEATFLELCERMKDGKDYKGVQGTTIRDGESIIKEKERPFIPNLDDIPSPYLLGLCDELLSESYRPNIETTRGCPFSCTFCQQGEDYYNKVRRVSLDRTKQELKYLAQKSESKTGDSPTLTKYKVKWILYQFM